MNRIEANMNRIVHVNRIVPVHMLHRESTLVTDTSHIPRDRQI